MPRQSCRGEESGQEAQRIADNPKPNRAKISHTGLIFLLSRQPSVASDRAPANQGKVGRECLHGHGDGGAIGGMRL